MCLLVLKLTREGYQRLQRVPHAAHVSDIQNLSMNTKSSFTMSVIDIVLSRSTSRLAAVKETDAATRSLTVVN